ncbi:sigma-70 family RNA polymerase sigma factor [Actinoallomurus purpureus]|uniref:RNA polymerase sigma factor n=1 Tax=Actinoallomurus purpureus TaxID=478114 RepID=UPI002092E9C9|nr:sigma-70 family RNA polymerase sigma factor [Actinoallomurus purpureus]MCO6004386.1 sigma-70 family RNA polymerase sigma factor [Actinoallomurus purpureus]
MDDPENSRRRFTELYDENYRRVLGYVITRTEPHAAEDIVSETFVIAWRRLDQIREPALPWLIGVARNLLLKQRDSGFRRRALVDRVTAMTTDADLVAWDVADHVVERDSALGAIARLSENDVEVLSLVMWHGLAPRDAAKVVGCSAAAFFVRLHRARRRLAKAIDNAPAPGARRPASRVADRATR